MIRISSSSGKIKLGPILFVFLLGLLVGQFSYRYLTRANKYNDEAVDLMNQGKYDSALEKLEQALDHTPDHVKATFHKGICLAEKHKFKEALKAFEATVKLDPNDAQAHYEKGRILWKLGYYAAAIKPLERATSLKAEYPDAWAILGECYFAEYLRLMAVAPEVAGSPSQAVAAFKAYLKQRPAATDRKVVERKLETLANAERYPELLEKYRQMHEAKQKELEK